jgi:hypothetical protein
MAATAGHRLSLDRMGKCSNMNIMRYGVNVNETTTPKSNCIRNAFFSETINQTQCKLHRNVPGSQINFLCIIANWATEILRLLAQIKKQ